jgi:retinoid hydroxylase
MKRALPPGNLGLPLIGETIAFLSDRNFATKRHQRYGDIFKTNLFGQSTIFLKGAEGNQFILSNENGYFRVSWPPSVKALLGQLSLALQTGHEHISRRKLLAQAFQPRALSGYVEAMQSISDRYFERWLELGEFTWYPELRNYTLDIACKLLIGLDNGSETLLGHHYETWCEGLFSAPIKLPFTRFGKALRSRTKLLAEIETLVRARKAQPRQSGNDDALDLMLAAKDDEGQGLSIEELKEQVLLLLFAGHETLTSALASLCLLLAQNPEALGKARVEQTELRSQPLTFETLKQMTYLDRVLKEVLRVVPPVGGGFREIVQHCEYQGYELPKGWQVLYQINSTHQDLSIYKDPNRFDPDRFSPERAEDRVKTFGHVPFGGGLRECLGKEFARLEMKLFAARLLREFDWQLLPGQDLSLVVIPTPKPKDGLQVRFRQHSAT